MPRIIFGSCSSQHYREQPLWPVIVSRNASAFVWGGDAVYADDRKVSGKPIDATPEHLRELYDAQLEHPGYKELLETGISIFGTIDDHDYGTNNGDRTFQWRRESAFEFVRFLGLPEGSPVSRRAAEGRGVYGVQVYDFARPHGRHLLSDIEAGLDPDVVPIWDENIHGKVSDENRRVAVFVLDIRSNKTPWNKSFPSRFQMDTEGDFLGGDQWTWFETAISRSNCAVNVVVTGLQVHAERFFDPSMIESWSGFASAQHRLHQVLLQPNVKAPILISGDVHKAQLMRKDCRKSNEVQAMRPLYEVTTSGMTHSWGKNVCGRINDNPFCRLSYYHLVCRHLMHLSHLISPWTELLLDEKTGSTQYSLDLNVAEMDFDWENGLVSLTILGEEGRILLQQDWSIKQLSDLEPDQTLVTHEEFQMVQKRLVDSSVLPKGENEWICAHYRGLPHRLHFAIGAALPPSLLIVLVILLPLLACVAGATIGSNYAWKMLLTKPSSASIESPKKKND